MTVPLTLPKRSHFKIVPNKQTHLNTNINVTEIYGLEGAISYSLPPIKRLRNTKRYFMQYHKTRAVEGGPNWDDDKIEA